tara:strand:- start:162 stop:350 length:189 start_codon:yes stop_codon:yes gene_type:complete
LKALRRRLDYLNKKAPQILNSEAEEAFSELISYLDSLASRKAGGDETAQIEIEAVSSLLSSK